MHNAANSVAKGMQTHLLNSTGLTGLLIVFGDADVSVASFTTTFLALQPVSMILHTVQL
jgi:hypothetical protein